LALRGLASDGNGAACSIDSSCSSNDSGDGGCGPAFGAAAALGGVQIGGAGGGCGPALGAAAALGGVSV
jgi:hypothetical protein